MRQVQKAHKTNKHEGENALTARRGKRQRQAANTHNAQRLARKTAAAVEPSGSFNVVKPRSQAATWRSRNVRTGGARNTAKNPQPRCDSTSVPSQPFEEKPLNIACFRYMENDAIRAEGRENKKNNIGSRHKGCQDKITQEENENRQYAHVGSNCERSTPNVVRRNVTHAHNVA